MKKKDSEDKKGDLPEESKDIKLKEFKELEDHDLKDFNVGDFKKARLEEFKDTELKDFKEFVKNSKSDRDLENLRLELNSDDVIKNTLKDLKKIGIDGKPHLKLLKRLKRGI